MNKNAYNRIAQAWSAARTNFVGREQDYMDLLLAGLPPESTILDLGCGTGRPLAQYAIAKGHRVVGIDQAEKLLDRARADFPDQKWIHASIESYEFAESYSAAIIWDTLFHISRELHEPILSRVVKRLPVAGRLMLTVGGSEHPAFTDVMFGQEFFYDSNSPSDTERILRRLGCDIQLSEFMNSPTGGRDKGRYAFIAEKSGGQSLTVRRPQHEFPAGT